MATDPRALLPLLALCAGCLTGSDAFIGGRLNHLCADSFTVCNVNVGCALDSEHYVRGSFPGARRVLVEAIEPEMTWSVRLYLDTLEAPGTELLVQLYEPDCSLDDRTARVHLEDVDLFDEAGPDRTLLFELETADEGDHLLEIFSDASASYLLIAEPMSMGSGGQR